MADPVSELLEIYGSNVTTTEGSIFRFHLRVVAPPFADNTGANDLVWDETRTQTLSNRMAAKVLIVQSAGHQRDDPCRDIQSRLRQGLGMEGRQGGQRQLHTSGLHRQFPRGDDHDYGQYDSRSAVAEMVDVPGSAPQGSDRTL